MIKQNFILLIYNKDVTCVIDEGKEPVCSAIPRNSRRSNSKHLPSHDPYIPRNDSILFNCSIECNPVLSYSLTALVNPKLNLKSCFQQGEEYECESIRYNYLKNNDKLLFLSRTIPDKTFYLVDCLVYGGGERVCHRKDNADTHANLVDTETLAGLKKPGILSQEDFLCEESKDKEVRCDLNSYVPFEDGLKLKDTSEIAKNLLLKTGTYVVILNRQCISSWCGYTGNVKPTRRQYSPPGGKVYRCYYANRQQICKKWYTQNDKELYNQRGWLSA